jgi:hypothetical protein
MSCAGMADNVSGNAGIDVGMGFLCTYSEADQTDVVLDMEGMRSLKVLMVKRMDYLVPMQV